MSETIQVQKRATLRGQVRERILRTILNHSKGISKYGIAKESGANIAWVIKTLRMLENEGIVDTTTVKDYAGLYCLWKKLKSKPKKREYLVREPLNHIRNTSMKYALTTYSAENLVQMYLFPSRTDLYIRPQDLADWHRLFVKNGLVGKGNVRVLMTDEHIFYNSFVREGLHVVSIPQLIVDLMTEGASAGEAAEMLIEKERENNVSKL